jgi:N6-L-threonylcarbamoyladenine synthase
VEALIPTLDLALRQAGIGLGEIAGIAVTSRPGLVGALSVGVTAAKALAMAGETPLIGVHHLIGHVLSPYLSSTELGFPHLCLMASGGHTELVEVRSADRFRLVGQTRDDAAGEAFDKSARLLGLGYPGGLAIQKAAESGDPLRYRLPKGLSEEDTFDFSFSGLKTAVLRLVEREGASLRVPDAASSVQEAITSVLQEHAVSAAVRLDLDTLTLVGGVAANFRLRGRLSEACSREGIRLVAAPIEYCTDNAAMIALAGSASLAAGQRHGLNLEPLANAPIDDVPGIGA